MVEGQTQSRTNTWRQMQPVNNQYSKKITSTATSPKTEITNNKGSMSKGLCNGLKATPQRVQATDRQVLYTHSSSRWRGGTRFNNQPL